MKKTILVITITIFLNSCATTKVDRKEPITLAEGVTEVVKTLNSMSKLQTEKINGLVPAEVTVEFNVTSGKKKNTNASLEIVPTGLVSKIGAGWSSEITESSGNKITLKFRSILFAEKDELIGHKRVNDLTKMFIELKNSNWNATLQ